MVAILVAFASLTAVAQVGELRGHVWMQQADGQKVPLADAQIDVFRTDISAKYNTKTNKKGEFVFAGLPFIGTYLVAASHPTARPNWVPGVKAGRDIDVELTLNGMPDTLSGSFSGMLVIQLGHPEKPEIKLPITGVCRGGSATGGVAPAPAPSTTPLPSANPPK